MIRYLFLSLSLCSLFYIYATCIDSSMMVRYKVQESMSKSRIDKRIRNLNTTVFDIYRKVCRLFWGSTSESRISKLNSELYTNTHKHLRDIVYPRVLAMCGSAVLGSFFYFIHTFGNLGMFSGLFVMGLMSCCPLIFFSSAYFLFLSPERLVKSEILKEIKLIENNYIEIFDSFYFSIKDDPSVNLNSILTNLRRYCSPDIIIFVDNMISDCRVSDKKVVETLKIRYSKSQKILDLANKIEKFTSGNRFTLKTMESARTELKNERIRRYKKKEERIDFINLMILMSASIISLVFILIIALFYVVKN